MAVFPNHCGSGSETYNFALGMTRTDGAMLETVVADEVENKRESKEVAAAARMRGRKADWVVERILKALQRRLSFALDWIYETKKHDDIQTS